MAPPTPAGSPANDPQTAEQDAARLTDALRRIGPCVVAFSAGVDSAVALKGARLALGDRAVGVIGTGAALAEGELQQAREVATLIGARLVEATTDEINDPLYQQNAPDRCFHCKTELYSRLRQEAEHLGLATIVNGANADDLGDHRPGMRAADEHRVRSPLVECGLGKERIRRLARHWGLPVWDKPAAPCLASRIAYGQRVTPERLAMIDRAEQWLRRQGIREVRVRYHEGDLARVEAPLGEVGRLAQSPLRDALVGELRRLGFKRVTLDLAGFESGSLNTLVPVESLTQAGRTGGA